MRWYQERGGSRSIEGPPEAESQAIWDTTSYQSLARGLLENLTLRDLMLKPFHECCRDTLTEGRSIAEKIGIVKKDVQIHIEDQSVKDRLDAQLYNIEVLALAHHVGGPGAMLIPDVSTEDYQRALITGGRDPINKILTSVIVSSYGLKDTIRLLMDWSLTHSAHHSCGYCDSCRVYRFCGEKKCTACGRTIKNRQYEIIFIDNHILELWMAHPEKFLEPMVFHALKSKYDGVGANLNVVEKGTTISEVDVFIRGKNLAFVCTISPENREEKRQTKIFKDMGLDVILITTSNRWEAPYNKICKGVIDRVITRRTLLRDILSLTDE